MTLLRKALDLRGKLSANDVTLKTIERLSKDAFNSMVLEYNPDDCIQSSIQFDDKKTKGLSQSVLAGIPISIKDNFNVSGTKASAGSKMLSSFVSPKDATTVEILKSNGAVIIPRANMDEFGMGSSMLHSSLGPCVNPWTQPGYSPLSPGGSSGGSAAIVSSGTVTIALASDTGGSVRQPASFCGVVGFKPTYGSFSRSGLISYASSMDTPGIICSKVADAAILFDALAVCDPTDMTSLRQAPNKICPKLLDGPHKVQSEKVIGSSTAFGSLPQVSAEDIERMLWKTNQPVLLKGFVIGIPDEFVLEEVSEPMRAVWQRSIEMLEDAGAEVRGVSIPSLRSALPCYYMIACAEASSNLSRYDGIRYGHRNPIYTNTDGNRDCEVLTAQAKSNMVTKSTTEKLFHMMSTSRGEGFGAEVIKRILTGTFVLSKGSYEEYFGMANKIRRKIRAEVDEVFRPGGCNLLLSPTCPELPFSLSSPPDSSSMMLNDIYTVPANLCGIPAISVPTGVVTNPLGAVVPIGMQLMAPRLGELQLFQAAMALEQKADFGNLVPSWVNDPAMDFRLAFRKR